MPITGRKGADIAHEWLAPEVKSRLSVPAWLHSAMAQARGAAKPEQLPVVVLHEVGEEYKHALVIVRMDDWLDWFGPVEGATT